MVCLSDARHFRHFRASEDQNALFLCVERKLVIVAVFVKIPYFRQGAKPPFPRTTVLTTLRILGVILTQVGQEKNQ